jgi:hypothetical protein
MDQQNSTKESTAQDNSTMASEEKNAGINESPTDENDDGKATCVHISVEEDTTGDQTGSRFPLLDHNCLVCLEELPLLDHNCHRLTCCGKKMHTFCVEGIVGSNMSYEQKFSCPHCHQPHRGGKGLIKRLRKWVKKGTPWAQCMLGEHYFDGNEVPQSYHRAKDLYALAVEGGDANAMNHLGEMYAQPLGQCVEQSWEKALALFKRAAKLGEPQAQCHLARMYNEGICVGKSFGKAFALYKLSAEQGNVQAQFMMGGMCLQQLQRPEFQETPAEQDPVAAVKMIFQSKMWLKKAAAQGDMSAINTLNSGVNIKGFSALLDACAEAGSKMCSECGALETLETTDTGNNHKLKPCSRCRAVLYCNTACQKQHWKFHKKDCKKLAKKKQCKEM